MVNPAFLTNSGQELSPDIQDIQTPEGELHLRFFIASGQEFALPANGIKEVMQLPPERITAIPNASRLLLGTINLRGQVIWVADLGQFLGVPIMLNTQRQEIPIIVVEDQEILLGLAIEKLGNIEWLDLEKLKMPPTNIADSMTPFVPGEWMMNEEDLVLLRLLDHIAILRSARWAA
jgi:purine-binding chemotaxis protein CheW